MAAVSERVLREGDGAAGTEGAPIGLLSTKAEIAARLFLSESTVKQHLRAAYKALGLRNRRETAALWRRWRRWWASIGP